MFVLLYLGNVSNSVDSINPWKLITTSRAKNSNSKLEGIELVLQSIKENQHNSVVVADLLLADSGSAQICIGHITVMEGVTENVVVKHHVENL